MAAVAGILENPHVQASERDMIVAASRFATRISSARLIPQRNGPAGGSAVYVSFPAILFAILRT